MVLRTSLKLKLAFLRGPIAAPILVSVKHTSRCESTAHAKTLRTLGGCATLVFLHGNTKALLRVVQWARACSTMRYVAANATYPYSLLLLAII
jgi:hypothetical protein